TQGFWRRLCVAVEHPEWIDDPRFATNAARLAHRDELLGLLEEIFATKTRAEWLSILEEADVPNSPVLELHDAVRAEQAVHNGVVQRIGPGDKVVDVIKLPIASDRWRPSAPTLPPVMGEHTDEILSKLLGLDRAHIDELVAQSVVARAEGSDA